MKYEALFYRYDLHFSCGDQETQQAVAIKTVNRNGLSQKLFDNLRGEIDILKALSHRHITRLLDLVVRTPCLLPELFMLTLYLSFAVW